MDNALSEKQDLAKELSAAQYRASELVRQLQETQRSAEETQKKLREQEARAAELEKRGAELDAALEERYHLQVWNKPSRCGRSGYSRLKNEPSELTTRNWKAHQLG